MGLSQAVRSVRWMPFDPWTVLRSRPHLELVWACVHPSRGRLIDIGDGRRQLIIDPCLDQWTRNATLTHELVHDQEDLLWVPGTPPWIVERGERLVRRLTADLLVDPWELRAYIDRCAERGFDTGIQAFDVAQRFRVPLDVAQLALELQPVGF